MSVPQRAPSVDTSEDDKEWLVKNRLAGGENGDGVLNVRLPRTEKAKPKSVEVKVS
jgi:HSP20 family molecular chaperone IbpA